MVPAKDFKRRMVVEIDGAPHMIEHIQVQTPSARGAATLYKIKARNLKTRTRVEKTYRGTDALTESSFERRPVQFLYRDADGFHFMDSADFNQFSFSADDLEDQAPFMTENMEGVEALVVDDEVDRDRDPRHGRAADHRDRARRPRQLGHRPDQAGDALDRPRHPGARAPRPGRDGPGRHADRRVPRPGELTRVTSLNSAHAARAANEGRAVRGHGTRAHARSGDA